MSLKTSDKVLTIFSGWEKRRGTYDGDIANMVAFEMYASTLKYTYDTEKVILQSLHNTS